MKALPAASTAAAVTSRNFLRIYWPALGLGLAFLVLAALVDVGAFTRIDQWAVDHVMPALRPRSTNRPLGSTLVPIFHARRGSNVAVAATAYGVAWIASVIPSVVLFAAGSGYLVRRGRVELALRAGLAFVVVNAVEVLAKLALHRPGLFGTDPRGIRVRVQPFDSSFPSGHAARAVLLAALACVCWPRIRAFAVAWLVSVLVLLVVGAWHTPSDVVGSVLLAGAFVCTWRGSERHAHKPLLWGRASINPGRFR